METPDTQHDTSAATATLVKPEQERKQPWLWNVVLLDSDVHTYEYVITMVQKLFAHPVEKAYTIAKHVDTDGRGVCLTTHKEHAELKRDQIIAFGRDPLMADCKGSMHAVIEPAWGDDDGADNADRTNDGRRSGQ